METIKIVDKLTLRQEALRMAVMQAETGVTAGWLLEYAKEFESYIQGSADLPEYVDPNADKQQWVDMLNKMREEMKPNPWISVNSEMKPAKGQWVVCALQYGSTIEYVTMYYNHEEKEWCGGNDDDNTNHVVAWCPFVPFTQPLL